MNKISNWVFGSFFRTIGRVIAFIVIGGIIGIILTSNDFKMPKIDDLFSFEKIKADTFDQLWLGTLYKDSAKTQNYDFILQTPAIQGVQTGTMYGGYYNYEFYHETRTITGANYIIYTYYINNQSSVSNNLGPQFHVLGYIISPQQGTLWCENVVSNTNSKYGQLKCPIKTQTINITGINTMVFFTNDEAVQFKFGLQASATIQKPSSNDSVSSAIESQTQNDNSNTQDIINNQNQTTQEIINNQEQNTQDIINNQESNTNKTIESQQVCTKYDKNSIKEDNKYIATNGNLYDSQFWGITDYIKIDNSNINVLLEYELSTGAAYCIYNTNKTLINCYNIINLKNQNITKEMSYIRVSINKSLDKPQFEICKNGNQALTDTMTDDDVSDAENSAESFFSDFEVEDHGGLSGIITAPLNTISNLVNNTCTPLVLPLPFVNENLTLPCLSDIYTQHFGAFYTIYQGILLALISYRCLRSLFYDTRGFINPEDDRIEVLDL